MTESAGHGGAAGLAAAAGRVMPNKVVKASSTAAMREDLVISVIAPLFSAEWSLDGRQGKRVPGCRACIAAFG